MRQLQDCETNFYGGKMALASLSPRVKNVFEIVRLEQIFSLHPDVAAGLAALKG